MTIEMCLYSPLACNLAVFLLRNYLRYPSWIKNRVIWISEYTYTNNMLTYILNVDTVSTKED